MNILRFKINGFALLITIQILLFSCTTTDLSQEDKILLTEMNRLSPISTFGVDLAFGSLSTETYSVIFTIQKEPNIAHKMLETVLNEIGSHVVSHELETKKMYIQAVIGSGALNMNPAFVKIEYLITETGIDCELISYAKEGLIKQKTAEKAARKVISELSKHYVEGSK